MGSHPGISPGFPKRETNRAPVFWPGEGQNLQCSPGWPDMKKIIDPFSTFFLTGLNAGSNTDRYESVTPYVNRFNQPVQIIIF